jgi:hypothetical protein
MESHKRTKPHYSQCCDRLYEQVTYLLGGESDEPGVIERRINETEDQSFQYWLKVRQQQQNIDPSYF